MVFVSFCADEDGDEEASLASLAGSLDSEMRTKLANMGTALSTSKLPSYVVSCRVLSICVVLTARHGTACLTGDKGGYKGLGFASEFEAVKEVDNYDCNAGTVQYSTVQCSAVHLCLRTMHGL